MGQQVLDLGPVLDGGSQAPVGGGAVRRPQITARRSGWLIEAIKIVYTRLGLGEAVSDDWAFEQMVVACLIAATSKAEPLRVLSEIGCSGPAHRNTLYACLAQPQGRGYRESISRALFDHVTVSGGPVPVSVRRDYPLLSSPGFCGGWFIWCRWLPVVIVRGGGGGGGGRVPRRLRGRRGAPMWCVKRRRVVSWLVVGRRGVHLGSWRAGSGCGGGPGRERPGPRRFALVSFALVVGPGDGVGAQGGEGGGEHGALEPLVAAVGDAPRHGSMSRSGV